jgi:hypothetical protein
MVELQTMFESWISGRAVEKSDQTPAAIAIARCSTEPSPSVWPGESARTADFLSVEGDFELLGEVSGHVVGILDGQQMFAEFFVFNLPTKL